MPRPYILIVDDQKLDIAKELMGRGTFQPLYAKTIPEAIAQAEAVPGIKFALLDMVFNDYRPYGSEECDDGQLAGLRLHLDLLELLPKAKFLFKTSFGEIDKLKNMAKQRPSVVPPFVYPGNLIPAETIEDRAGAAYRDRPPMPRVFIVHGRDSDAVTALVGLLKSDYGLTDKNITILREQAGAGAVVLENFERHARQADLVIALLTPDDRMEDSKLHRARQNVIFEIGYFYAALRRLSGSVILMKKGDVEMPSDMAGLWPIDITRGVASARKKLDAELANLGFALKAKPQEATS